MLNSTWDDCPERYSELRRSWLSERRLAFIRSYLVQRSQALSIFELGSGTGELLIDLSGTFPERTFVGLEPLLNYIEFAKKAAARASATNVEFLAGVGERLEAVAPERRFDLVLSNDVLHHVADLRGVVAQLSGRVSTGTRWLAIEPNCLNPYMGIRQSLSPGEKNFRPSQFVEFASTLGWRLIQRRYLFLIPSFMKTAPSWLKRVERVFEPIPIFAGGIALELEKS